MRAERVDADIAAMLEAYAALQLPPLSSVAPALARQAVRKMTETATPTPIESVENTQIPTPSGTIPVRIYRPRSDIKLPVLVYYHGGGWVLCDLDTHDESCRKLASAGQCVLVSVDYRLAPEHPFPAGLDDAYAALNWVAAEADALHVDAERLAVGGDSAGGNLAAAVALRARDESGPALALQLLIYPVTDVARMDTDSYDAFGRGYRLDSADMAWFRDQYLDAKTDASQALVSPLRAADLSGLPAAYVATAGFDVLRDEGKAYAAALSEAGVAVQYQCFSGQVHGFMGLANTIESSALATQVIGEQLNQHLSKG